MARKKKEQYPIEGYPWDKENTPWGQEAEHYSQSSGEPFDKCRDFVILLYLKCGDPIPLAALLMTGEAPGPVVLKYLAGMMGAPNNDKFADLPFELIIKGRKGNKRKDRTLVWRDFAISKNVENAMSDNEKYEFAVSDIAEAFDLGNQLVRDAYDKRHTQPKPKGN